MKSFSALYIDLMKYLKESMPEVKHIDLWNNQPFNESQENAYNIPALFIEMPAAVATRISNKRYKADCTIRVHILADFIGDVDDIAPEGIRNGAFEHLQVLDDVVYFLDGHSSETVGYNSIGLESIEFAASDNDALIYHILTFKTQLNIDAAKRTYIVKPRPAFEVSAEIPE